MERLVRMDGRYRMQNKLGFGSFGNIYLARDILSGQDVVVKLESVKGEHLTIEHEFHVYKKLGQGTGIPRVHWFGTEAGFNAMAIESLGPSLEELFTRCHQQFSVKTVLLLASQMCHRLQYIHSHNFIHRDLKPSNLVIGVGKRANIVYLIDFGLSKEFRDPDTYLHIPFKEKIGLTGTAMFASIHSHVGVELGRRDDLESLAYILIYFLRGSLPWQGLSYDLIAESKQQISLCYGLPAEICTLLKYSRSLAFVDKPDYGYLRHLFDDRLRRESSQNDQFDWDIINGQIDGQRRPFL